MELLNICKSFNGKTVLEQFSYKFPDKGLFALTGTSGKGKTTLLRIISRLETPDKGIVRCAGDIAYSFQEYRLFANLTVLENIELVSFKKANEHEKERIRNYLKRLSLLDSINKYPNELSGGMKQRVSLIRAFVSDAKIILLDEPTKELDEALIRVVVEIIQELSRNKLVIFTAHDSETVRNYGAEVIEL
jgi:ABC-type multidrug transport system ATPase subunit